MNSKIIGDYVVYFSALDKPSKTIATTLKNETADLVYWDTRFLGFSKRSTFLRPAWSAVRFSNQQYIGTCFAVKKSLITDSHSAGDALGLIANKAGLTINHIPKVLNTKFAFKSLTVESKIRTAIHRSELPEISFVIPSAFAKNASGEVHLLKCLQRLNQLPGNHEFLVVTDQNFDVELMKRIETLGLTSVVHVIDPEPFSYARRVNLGALAATKGLLATINDDVDVLSEAALRTMAGYLKIKGVGQVGIKLLYPDGRIQHAGHKHSNKPKIAYQRQSGRTDYFGDTRADREVSGVTGALTLQPTKLFNDLGGLCEGFPLSYNDVDYCLKTRAAGYSVVLVNSEHAIHHESASRAKTTTAGALEVLIERWGSFSFEEPYTRNPVA